LLKPGKHIIIFANWTSKPLLESALLPSKLLLN